MSKKKGTVFEAVTKDAATLQTRTGAPEVRLYPCRADCSGLACGAYAVERDNAGSETKENA